MASKDKIEKTWKNAKKIRGQDPSVYRQAPYGNTMYKPLYGKDTDMGWQVDHITPKARGGSDATRNLQALNTRLNREKADSLQKRSRHTKANK